MSIEQTTQRIEHEAQRNPEQAAAGIRLLTEAQQERILNQMQKDANDPNHMANFSVERDSQGHLKALNFTPLFQESTGLMKADSTTKR